ncbi:hypothetical protein KKHLCK_00935 [Candidatus Electrothrix laxa]
MPIFRVFLIFLFEFSRLLSASMAQNTSKQDQEKVTQNLVCFGGSQRKEKVEVKADEQHSQDEQVAYCVDMQNKRDGADIFEKEKRHEIVGVP